ncbi:sensor histidine kinase [Hufsiella ginkgonis]|uniref:histidine kinase n=1 Tax=Hufsiella ginkgonis TaxID=2695274 RepID=A0A7K1XWG6_9SPHI|nr:HAMP domain-containing sensor histidine kinase [Hufsiella ginkgonis]MXV15342.1 HAMP domain-containing protein [Hufsiella ginkgonis]
MKIQTKITILFFAISTAGLVLLNASIFYFVSEFNFEDFFKRLEARVKLSAQINISPDEKSAAYQEVRNRYLEKLDDEQDFVVRIDSGGRYVFKRPVNLPEKFYREVIRNGKARYDSGNRFYAGGFFNTENGRYIVIVTASDPYGFKELAQLRKVLLISFVISILVTYVAGAVFSHYTMKPFRGIIKSVKNISANNLHSRLEEVKGRDEIAELIYTFNNMLTRLETSFETQNNFVSNASHELRTPLAIITSEAELLLTEDKLPAKTSETVKTILSEAGKLEHILKSLLGLAQSGFDGKKQNWQKVRADELILTVIASVKEIDPESKLRPDLSGLPADETMLITEGNVNLLQLALSNIVLNACKYSANQEVTIRLTIGGERISISVTDKGIGIPEQEQQHIFEPFFRASNTVEFEGFGIGLPLALNIIRLHKGSIGIRSEENVGTEMQILLPISRN